MTFNFYPFLEHSAKVHTFSLIYKKKFLGRLCESFSKNSVKIAPFMALNILRSAGDIGLKGLQLVDILNDWLSSARLDSTHHVQFQFKIAEFGGFLLLDCHLVVRIIDCHNMDGMACASSGAKFQ